MLSHQLVPADIEFTVQNITKRIIEEGDKPYVTVSEQLSILEQLTQFDFGRFLLLNRGLNGFWTHYILTYPWSKRDPLSELERFILERAPVCLATQQRFKIFLAESQTPIKEGAKLASIPCGMMGDLLYLNYDSCKNIELHGIDFDPETLQDAKNLAAEKGLSSFIQLYQRDAWQLNFKEAFDLIASNGLNIYEPDDERVTELYHQFHIALKPGGKLVTSFLTPPPMLTDKCEWDLSEIDKNDMLRQKIIFADIIQAKWQCFRSSELTLSQLKLAGFNNIQFIYDTAKMFPTVIAYK